MLFISTANIQRYFSGKSEIDICSLYSDRTLINRRNVKAEPQAAYRADRYFFLLVVRSRVIAAAMKILGLDNKHSKPAEYPIPENAEVQSKQSQLQF